MAEIDQTRRARVILLGASNLTHGLVSAVATARSIAGAPGDLFIAAGLGRSYGVRSRVLGRSLPGILECGLWNAISSPLPRGEGQGVRAAPNNIVHSKHSEISHALTPALSPGERERCLALITDIGNDIMYGFEPDQIAAWVDQCVERLDQVGARVVMTALPMSSINRLGPRQYAFVKAMIFPTRKLPYRQALNRAAELDSLLREMAGRRSIELVEPESDWYGLDPIHVRRGHLARAWSMYMRNWTAESRPPSLEGRGLGGGSSSSGHDGYPATTNSQTSPTPSPKSGGPSEGGGIQQELMDQLRLRTAAPRHWRFLGVPLGRRQPCAQLSDGSRIHMY